MKRFLLWSFERGSIQYDVICLVILAFIFITPPTLFNDRPDFMRIASDEAIRQAKDDDGNPVWVVQVKTEQDAVDRLRAYRASSGEVITVQRTEPVHDSTGALVAYSIWVVR
jgi:hypothetical protein